MSRHYTGSASLSKSDFTDTTDGQEREPDMSTDMSTDMSRELDRFVELERVLGLLENILGTKNCEISSGVLFLVSGIILMIKRKPRIVSPA